LDQPDGACLDQVVVRLAAVLEPPGAVLDQRQVHLDQLVTEACCLLRSRRAHLVEESAGARPGRGGEWVWLVGHAQAGAVELLDATVRAIDSWSPVTVALTSVAVAESTCQSKPSGSGSRASTASAAISIRIRDSSRKNRAVRLPPAL